MVYPDVKFPAHQLATSSEARDFQCRTFVPRFPAITNIMEGMKIERDGLLPTGKLLNQKKVQVSSWETTLIELKERTCKVLSLKKRRFIGCCECHSRMKLPEVYAEMHRDCGSSSEQEHLSRVCGVLQPKNVEGKHIR